MNEPSRQDPRHEEIIQPVRPATEDAGVPLLRAAERRSGRGPGWPIAIGLAGLVAVALGVFFVLPSWVAGRAEQQAAEPSEPVEPVTEAAVEPQLSAEELEQLRVEAEALLAELLPQQARLEELSAESWGEETWVAYEAAAREGDDAYLANAFQDAVPAYARALNLGERLLARSVTIIEAALQAGRTALEAGNAALAAEQYRLVLGIEPDNATATRGLERAERLPEVLRLTREGDTALRAGALEEAAAAFRDALAIDAEWGPARAALATAESRLRTRSFDASMSRGFAALAEEDFDEALEHFTAALRIRPDAAEAIAGKLQAEQGQRLDEIALMEARGLAFERRELWQQAIEQYENALAADSTLVFAREGLERARRRGDLDSKITHLLQNPNLLFDDAVLADAQALLADALSVEDSGPRLVEQTAELERLLRLASTPIPVELRSDAQTEVTVYRVGSLGTFAQTTLELRPGTYTAVGSRDGYRDVRETFTILPGRTLEPIRVECVEPI